MTNNDTEQKQKRKEEMGYLGSIAYKLGPLISKHHIDSLTFLFFFNFFFFWSENNKLTCIYYNLATSVFTVLTALFRNAMQVQICVVVWGSALVNDSMPARMSAVLALKTHVTHIKHT